MSSITQCPICGKAGIPDYLEEDVICPNCNSDLSVYRSLHSAVEEGGQSTNDVRKYKRLAIILPIVVAILFCCIGLLYYSSSQRQIKDANATIAELKITRDNSDEVNKVQPAAEPSQHYIEYVILRNDSPWKIVNRFYGLRSDWQDVSRKLAELNGIWDDETGSWSEINPGQVIRIYNIR